MSQLSDVLKRRATWIVQHISQYLPAGYPHTFFIAGGSVANFTSPPNDIDIYTQSLAPNLDLNAPVIRETAAATTYATVPWPIQVSRYPAENLMQLLTSFDFTHVQAGALIARDKGVWKAVAAQYTGGYLSARELGNTEFTGSDFPLMSLLRVGKYYHRNDITREAYTRALVAALIAVLRRGFTSYEDFLAQLVGLSTEDDLSEMDDTLRELFLLLCKSEQDDVCGN